MVIREGDYVLLVDDSGNEWLVKVRRDYEFTTHHGKLNLGDLIGLEYGCICKTHTGRRLYVLKPTLEEYILHSKRPTQIVYPKDIGYILLKSGLRSDSIVLEVGTGSGAITTTLCWFIREGIIDSYERRRDIAEVALLNLKRLNCLDRVRLHIMDFKDAEVDRDYYDLAIVDVDTPWEVINKVYYAIKPSASIFIILPTYNQLDKLLSYIKSNKNIKLVKISAEEVFIRELQAEAGRIRPYFRMIGYTAVLFTARKVRKE